MGTKNILLCFDERLVVQAEVLMMGLRENLTGQLAIYSVVTNKTFVEFSESLFKFASELNFQLFLQKETDYFSGLKSSARSTIAYEKFLFPRFLPDHVKKILYLDIDIVPIRNLDDLFDLEFDEPFAAVALDDFISRRFQRWFKTANGGVNFFNVESYKNAKCMEQSLHYINNNLNPTELYTDLVLNHILYDKWKKLDSMYNTSYLKAMTTFNWRKRRKIRLVHFIGSKKPWKQHFKAPWNLRASHLYNRRNRALMKY